MPVTSDWLLVNGQLIRVNWHHSNPSPSATSVLVYIKKKCVIDGRNYEEGDEFSAPKKWLLNFNPNLEKYPKAE